MCKSDAAARTRSRISPRGMPRFSQPNAISDVVSKLKNWLRGFWNTEPTAQHRSSISQSAMLLPHTSTRPVASPAYTTGISPFTMRVSVVFPQPEGPVTTTH